MNNAPNTYSKQESIVDDLFTMFSKSSSEKRVDYVKRTTQNIIESETIEEFKSTIKGHSYDLQQLFDEFFQKENFTKLLNFQDRMNTYFGSNKWVNIVEKYVNDESLLNALQIDEKWGKGKKYIWLPGHLGTKSLEEIKIRFNKNPTQISQGFGEYITNEYIKGNDCLNRVNYGISLDIIQYIISCFLQIIKEEIKTKSI